MVNLVNVLSKLNINANSGIIFNNNSEYPENPEIGQLAFVDKILVIYSDVNGSPSWFPLLNANVPTYKHTQGLESLNWSVNHNLITDDLMYFVYDDTNSVIYPSSITFTDSNSFLLHFNEPIKGKCIVFSGDLKIVGDNGVDSIEGLQDELDAKADNGHDHDIRYYNQTQVDTKLQNPDYDIIPVQDNVHSLGSPSNMWKDGAPLNV